MNVESIIFSVLFLFSVFCPNCIYIQFYRKRLFVQMEPVDVAGILQMAGDADLMTHNRSQAYVKYQGPAPDQV